MLFRALILWSLVLLLEAIVVIFLVPPTVVVNAAHNEEGLYASTMGDDAADAISSEARQTFDRWFIDTGIVSESFALFVPSEQAKRNSTGIETLAANLFESVRRRLESAWNLVFVAIQRAHGLAMWFPALLPFLIAAVFDGFTERKVKLLSFGISSAPVFGAFTHLLVLLCFFPLFYFAWPFAVTPMVVPFWFIALAITVKTIFSNLQRM